MKKAPLLNVEIPDDARIQNLLDDYTATDAADLKAAFMKIDKKLGGQNLKAALEALDRNDYAAAARIALRYYDKTYQHCLESNPSTNIRHLTFETGNPEKIAQYLAGMN